MAQHESKIEFGGELSAIVYRADGRVEDLGVISGLRPVKAPIVEDHGRFHWLLNKLKRKDLVAPAMGVGALVASLMDPKFLLHNLPLVGVVTAAGVNYMAADFISGGVTPTISGMKFHAMGTGAGHGGTQAITVGPTNATPIVCTITAHGYTTNDILVISGTTGNTAANGNFQISPVTANTFTLLGSVGNGAPGGSPIAQLLNGAADTTLTTDSGVARVIGTPTNPSANIYKSVATLAFVSTLSIVEWGIFSALTTGTMWDRRWFNSGSSPSTTAAAPLTPSAIGVNSGDSIQVSYSLTISAGGS